MSRTKLVVGAATALALVVPMGATAFAATTSLRLEYPTLNRQLRDHRINESSGLAYSTWRRPVLFTEEDSGGGPHFFAIGKRSHTRAYFTLRGATARDWEDMSNGPRHTLWLGDIGDNSGTDATVQIYRVREPRQLHNENLPWTRYDLRYTDGGHNSEALLVRPTTGRVFLVTKGGGNPGVYRGPKHLSTRHVNLLRRVASAPSLITAGAFAPGGQRLVLRNHDQVFFYRHIGARPRVYTLPSGMDHGESVTFGRFGHGLLLGREGSDSPVWRIHLR